MDKKRVLKLVEEAGNILIIMAGVEQTHNELNSMKNAKFEELVKELEHVTDAEAERLLKKVYTVPFELEVLSKALAKRMSQEKVKEIKRKLIERHLKEREKTK